MTMYRAENLNIGIILESNSFKSLYRAIMLELRDDKHRNAPADYWEMYKGDKLIGYTDEYEYIRV